MRKVINYLWDPRLDFFLHLCKSAEWPSDKSARFQIVKKEGKRPILENLQDCKFRVYDANQSGVARYFGDAKYEIGRKLQTLS